jgi:hypothetical protein
MDANLNSFGEMWLKANSDNAVKGSAIDKNSWKDMERKNKIEQPSNIVQVGGFSAEFSNARPRLRNIKENI